MTPDFSASAQKLARNPLGIIALFLLLVYGIAGLVFSTAAKSLAAWERQPLVWFLVIFPVLVLGVFGWLVACHHTKLYAPSDYSDPEGFFRAMTPGEQRARLDAEVESLQADTTQTESPRSSDVSSDDAGKRIPSVKDDERGRTRVEASNAKPDDSRVPTEQLVGRRRRLLRAAVVLAEELACRKLEAEFGLPVLRHVRLTNGAQVDGLIRTALRPTAIEIKYTRSAEHVDRIASEVMAQALSIETGSFLGPLQVLLVIVVDAPTIERTRVERELKRHFGQQRRIDYRVFDFRSLQEEFGVAPA